MFGSDGKIVWRFYPEVWRRLAKSALLMSHRCAETLASVNALGYRYCARLTNLLTCGVGQRMGILPPQDAARNHADAYADRANGGRCFVIGLIGGRVLGGSPEFA
ncbi:hypothetical protein KCP69_08385 [Salmonella enterica subsp. enterica]|nr:hypothetical protein KCP69_08385 [Salmonella enterica subsp. enterica]